jgi:hypothetical protein
VFAPALPDPLILVLPAISRMCCTCAEVLTMHSLLHLSTTPQVLACIGEQFDEGDEVCGVTVNIRNGKDRLELWSKTAANEALQMSVGKQLKQMLDIPDSNKIGFVVFVSTCLVHALCLVPCIPVLLQRFCAAS